MHCATAAKYANWKHVLFSRKKCLLHVFLNISGRRLHLVKETSDLAATNTAATDAAALPVQARREDRAHRLCNKGAFEAVTWVDPA